MRREMTKLLLRNSDEQSRFLGRLETVTVFRLFVFVDENKL